MDINYDAITGKTNFAEIIKITTNSMKKLLMLFRISNFRAAHRRDTGRGGRGGGESHKH